MCNWEQTFYEGCGHSVKARMPYSCTIYVRWVYGKCKFDPRRDQFTSRVISYDICPNDQKKRQTDSDTFDTYVDYPDAE
ncbi:hypothetical protein B0T18DRAFT_313009 [Schizothecium vesticola]|uniref:Uncharacterized protein n=1 Tax=Schizothecium vesticola TaxID=314040 RepID=A0AA40KBC9_9PEZI|nr:hypothetical protein B0T18DRAFT_313009 [Schizothecium vesticola]